MLYTVSTLLCMALLYRVKQENCIVYYWSLPHGDQRMPEGSHRPRHG
ncbi:unnamed protein product, partial [Staurois parvus]